VLIDTPPFKINPVPVWRISQGGVCAAPNYCYRCGNIAAIMAVDETSMPHTMDEGVVTFESAPMEARYPARPANQVLRPF
jgi:hypothetical protein